MMVSMNTFSPNLAAMQANPANTVAKVKAQAEAVKMQADALELQSTKGKKATPAKGVGKALDLQA
jgi:hypothetical protein